MAAHRGDPGFTYTVEQPEGSALAKDPEVIKVLGQPTLVRQCCYGYLHCKPTLIWTNLTPEEWTPRSFKKGETTWCKCCRAGVMHKERIIRRNSSDKRPAAGSKKMKGFTFEAVKNRINPNLAEELATAAMNKAEAARPHP